MSQNLPDVGERTIDSFRSRLVGGGARPNLFEVKLVYPEGIATSVADKELPIDTRFMVKAANLPASNINVIDIPFRGRNLKIAGDRTFDIWTITVINDTSFRLRNAFEAWMNRINRVDNATGEVTPIDYQTNAYVYQLGRDVTKAGSSVGVSEYIGDSVGKLGKQKATNAKVEVLKTYKFHGIFPTNVSAIELSYDQSDSVEEFTVDLQVQWWDAYRQDEKASFLTGYNQNN
tara:strand:- start:42 stop:737 length:696 start_codon:yes stop_codon:yes gene_type:complete